MTDVDTERYAEFILAQGQTTMKSTLFTVGPYMDMLLDGMFKPTEEHEDGTLVWENPAGKSSPLTDLSFPSSTNGNVPH